MTPVTEPAPSASQPWEAAASDLAESCPELRPVLLSPQDEVAWLEAVNRSRIGNDQLRAYEWWQLDALDRDGNALSISLYHGNPFDPAYRRALRHEGRDEDVNRKHLLPASFPALRMSLMIGSSVAARAYRTASHMHFTETGAHRPTWSAGFEDFRLSYDSSDNGWRLTGEVPLDQIGLMADLGLSKFYGKDAETSGPRPTAYVDVTITPLFDTPTLQRASMPDSPAGNQHDWLLMCPAGVVNGSVTIRPRSAVRLPHKSKHKRRTTATTTIPDVPADSSSRLPDADLPDFTVGESIQGNSWTFRFDRAYGSLDHFWGSGLIGNGMRRWYRARLPWDTGTVVAEIPTVRKYIQLAGTLMWFRPDAPPQVARCGLPGKPVFQRGAWLLAYPRSIDWSASSSRAQVTHEIERLADVSPGQGMAVTSAEFEAGLSPFETSHGPAAGLFEMIQPSRVDWRLWQRWAGPRREPETQEPMIV